MEFRQFRFFLAVAEELNFSRAAERLNIAQPALSKQIQHIEEEIGTPLFIRTKRTVQLTEAGLRLKADAPRLLRAHEEAIRSARMASRGEIGEVAVGFVASTAFALLPGMLRNFARSFPSVQLRLRDLTTSEQCQALLEKTIDVGFVRPPIDAPDLESRTIAREELIAILPSSHPLAVRTAIHLPELAGDKFIALSHELAPGLFSQFQRVCHRAGFSPRIAEEVGQLDIAVAFVAATMGVSVLPASVSAFRHSGASYIHLLGVEERSEIAMVWRRESPSPATLNFIETVTRAQADGPVSVQLA